MSRHDQKNALVGGLRVEVRNNDVNKALRKFKKKVAEDGILQDLRKREYFESKGTKRRLEKQAAIRRYKKKRLKEQDQW
jgi:small subunit ribosomal protein S21